MGGIRLKVLLGAAAVIGAAVATSLPSVASAATTPQITSVSLRANSVREPGRIGVLVQSSGCITHVVAWASSGAAKDTVHNPASTYRGTKVIVYLPFAKGHATGTWYLTNVTALQCGTRPTPGNPWNAEWDGFDKFTVLPPAK